MSERSHPDLVFSNFQSLEELEATVTPGKEFHVVRLDEKPMSVEIWQLKLDRGNFEFRHLHAPLRIWGDKQPNYLVFELIVSPIFVPYLSHGFEITNIRF